MQPDPYIQFLENWIPGIGEDTKLHDQLHIHFDLGFSVNDELQTPWFFNWDITLLEVFSTL